MGLPWKQVPFLGLDGLPPGDRQADLVAPGHKDVAMVGEGIFPDSHPVGLSRQAAGKILHLLYEFAELRFMKGVLDPKHAICCGPPTPEMFLNFCMAVQVKFAAQVGTAVEPLTGLACHANGFECGGQQGAAGSLAEPDGVGDIGFHAMPLYNNNMESELIHPNAVS